MCGVQPPAVVVDPSLFLEAVLPFVRVTPLSDLALVCSLALLCGALFQAVCVEKRTVSSTLSSTVPLQQAAWGGVLRPVRGCVHAALPCVVMLLLAGAQVRPGTLMISPGLAHLSDTGFLRIVRAVIASPLAIKMYSLDFIRKPTIMPDSILSSAFVRSVNGPARYHTCSPNTHLPMWCPRPRHRSNDTFPSDPNRVQVQQRGGVPNDPSNGL